MADGYTISPIQGVQLMALAEILRERILDFRGDDADEEQSARDLIQDVAQEIALQVPRE